MQATLWPVNRRADRETDNHSLSPFRVTNESILHVFGLWEEAAVSGEGGWGGGGMQTLLAGLGPTPHEKTTSFMIHYLSKHWKHEFIW